MLAPKAKAGAFEISTAQEAAILALLWEVDSRQKGDGTRRIKTTELSAALGMGTNLSSKIGLLTDKGLCEELPGHREDRREKYYAITKKGKQALDEFLDRQYMLADDVYRNSHKYEKDTLNALKVTEQDVKSRMDKLLP